MKYARLPVNANQALQLMQNAKQSLQLIQTNLKPLKTNLLKFYWNLTSNAFTANRTN